MALTRPKFNNIDSTIVKLSDAVLTINEGNATQQTMGIAFDRSGWSLDSVGLIWNHTEQRFELGTLSSNGISSTAPSIVSYGTFKANTFLAETVSSDILSANSLAITDLELISNSDTNPYEFYLTRSRGNVSSPTAVQTGDEIFKITGNARNAVDYTRVVSLQSFSTGTNSANLEVLLHDGVSLDTRLTLDSSGELTVTGNVTGNYFIGNGALLTGISAGAGNYSDSNVTTLLSNFGSNSISTTGDIVTGNILPSANATYNIGSPTNRFNTLYLVGNTIDLGGATISADGDEGVVAIIPQVKSSQSSTKAILIGDTGVATADTDNFGRLSKSAIQEAMASRVTVTGSLIANTLITTEGNVVGGNLKTNGQTIVHGIQSLGEDGITSGGNIQAPYFLGNGALLSGIGNHYQDSDVANLLADLGPTSISTNSNITANIITATTFVGDGSQLTGIASLTVAEIDSGNTLSNSVSSISTLSFDQDSGFAIDDVGNGVAKVRTNSTFKTLVVDGQANLVAQGLDTLEIISGNGISLTTDPNSDPKSLTISGTYGDSNVSALLTNYATTSYVDTEISNLVASAPATLDTLNELASALNDDANFATTVTNLIGNNSSNIATLQTEVTALDNQVANLNYYDDTNVTTFLSDIGSNSITTTGNITADYFVGNGSALTGINAGANVTVSDTPPTSPSAGDVWIDSNIGVQLIYIDDGDSSQWVDMQYTIQNVGGGSYGDSDVLSYLGAVSGNIIPSSNVTYNLGSETNRWNTLYLAGNTIDLGGAQIKADPDAGTIALIPQVTPGQNSTKAIVIGRRGISTVDTDNSGQVSSADIESAATSANTSTGNLTVTGNITTGNLITDNIFFANGDPFVSGGGGGTSYDEASTSTGYFGLPVGTTEQRPGTPAYGMIRFNSNIGTVEIYNNNAWERVGGVISVTGVNPNTFSGNSGTTFTISGVGFTSGAIVSFITNSSAEYSAGTTTFINSSQLQASTPRDFTIDDEPLSVKVTNPSGITGVKTNAIDCGGSPTFATASGTLGNIYNSSRSYTSHLNMTATDADGQGVTYSVTAGTIPAGLTFNNSTGTFSGTASSVANDTTYTFTVTASDGINETSRQFSVTVKAAVTETFNSAGSVNWTSPAGVVKIDNLIMIGGGGGGNAGYQAYGWAGGGAGYVNAVDVTIESDTLYSLTVGAGGPGAIGASTTVAGENGGDTTAFNNTAFGGEGGQTGRSGLGGSYQVNNGTDNGSAAGTGGGTSGNNGKNGGTNGGGSAYGVGATATGNYTPGNSATGNGNGAGGGSSSQNWIGTRSGTGSGGLITITY